METRIAVIGIIVENKDSVESVNELLHQYSQLDNIFHFGQSQEFYFGADGLQDELAALESGARIFVTVYK